MKNPDNPFYACSNNLQSLPEEFKSWKTLEEYRAKWAFLPFSLRHRVAEQCMACDYLVSLEKWLQPVLTIRLRQRIILIGVLASIYEGVLGHVVDNEIKKRHRRDPIFKETFHADKFGDRRTFGPTLRVSGVIGLLDTHWQNYLGYMNQIRNWTHLSQEESQPLKKWIEDRSCEELRGTLDEFRRYLLKHPGDWDW